MRRIAEYEATVAFNDRTPAAAIIWSQAATKE